MTTAEAYVVLASPDPRSVLERVDTPEERRALLVAAERWLRATADEGVPVKVPVLGRIKIRLPDQVRTVLVSIADLCAVSARLA